MKKITSLMLFLCAVISVCDISSAQVSYYDIMLKAALGANDLDTAQAVIESALKELKENAYFLEWGYRVSLWKGNLDKAVDYALRYYQLTRNYDKDMLNLFLAKGLFDVALDIMEQEILAGKEVNLDDYYFAVEKSFQVEKRMKFLKSIKGRYPKALKYLGILNYNIGEFDKAKDYINQYLSKVDSHWEQGYRLLAEISFLGRDYEKSLSYLLEYEKIKQTKGQGAEDDVLKDIAILAWDLGKKDIAFRYVERLREEGKGRPEDYTIAIKYLEEKAPELALEYAFEGFRKFKSDYLLAKYMLMADKVGWTKEYLGRIENLPESLRLIRENSIVLSLYAKALAKLGEIQKAKKLYEDMIKVHGNETLIGDYLWLLIEIKDYETLKNHLRKYEDLALRGSTNTKLAFISAYMLLQDSQKAKRVYLFLRNAQTEENLYLYSFVLDAGGQVEEGRSIRYNLYQNYRNLEKPPADWRLAEMVLNLYREFDPVKYEGVAEEYKKVLPSKTYWEIHLAHLINLQAYEKFKVIARQNPEAVRKWMDLSIALEDWDKDKQLKLLKESKEELPIRDRVTATERSGNVEVAKSLAFEGLEKNPEDYLLYKQFRDLYMNYSNKVLIEPYFLSSKYTNRFDLRTDYRLMITNEWLLKAKPTLRYFTSKNREVIYNLPSVDKELVLDLCHKTERGVVCVGGGGREGVENYSFASLSFSHYLKDSLALLGFFGKNVYADDSVYVAVGGKKDSASLGLSYSLNSRVAVSASYAVEKVYSQDDEDVGNAEKFTIETFYKLRISYPDFTFRWYCQSYTYGEKSGSKGSLDRISPIINNRFLPSSFWQTGLEFSFGYDNRYLYTRTARPFMSSGIGYNSEGGLIFGLSGGYGFTLTKSDNLAIELNLYRSVGRFEETNLGFSILYQRWF